MEQPSAEICYGSILAGRKARDWYWT